jgi:membrane protease YdiL (CAAX protease family)
MTGSTSTESTAPIGPVATDPPVEYHRVLAGEKRRIGRGILAITLVLVGLTVLPVLAVVTATVLDAQWGTTRTPGGTYFTVLSHAAGMAAIALVTPLSMLVQRWLYGVPGPSLHSVFSRFRLDVLGRAVLLIGPLWVVLVVVQYALVGPTAVVELSFLTVVGLLGVNLLLVPLQAAGEEYGLRGLVFRVAGSWTRGRRAGLVLGIVVSAVLFTALHASTDPVMIGYYLVFSVATAVVTWRTGGIEIAVVVHALNNMIALTVAVGVREDIPGRAAERSGSLLEVLPYVVGHLIVLAVVLVVTRRGAPAAGARW